MRKIQKIIQQGMLASIILMIDLATGIHITKEYGLLFKKITRNISKIFISINTKMNMLA